ncbi:MAG: hypothetical protein SOT69_07105, partial [Mesosutterella sp.]|nr:hypothetical protein [Mesosutterella sp.]
AVLERERVPPRFSQDLRKSPYTDAEFDTESDAMKYMIAAIPLIMQEGSRNKKKAIPLPSAVGAQYAYVPLKHQARIMLWNHMVKNRYRIADIARLLDMAPSQASRLVDFRKDLASVDVVEKALTALGCEFNVSVSKFNEPKE